MKKIVILLSIFIFNSISAYALEYSSSMGGNQTSLNQVKKHITDVQNLITTIDNHITAIINCSGQTPPQFYNGTACVVVVEDDPFTMAHGKNNVAACASTNQAQYFDGTTWVCKAF